jgi:riboflavin kinase/FMN adenylyltransferase
VKILEGFLDLDPLPGPLVATIGNFDGAHRGHQRIFARVLDRARALQCPAYAVTFDPHPLKILRPDQAPRMILTRGQKIEILSDYGLDGVVFIPFDPSVADLKPELFVTDFLLDRLRVRELYIGVDFRFGRGRRGDLALLRTMSAELGGQPGAKRGGGGSRTFTVESVDVVRRDGDRISASLIREALSRGDVRAAGEMMGRPYEAIGLVIHGAGRGRSQGSPTANLDVANEMIPGSGVYVTEARLGEDLHPSLTNIGVRPTFEQAGFAIETWLPGFTGDIYGRHLRVLFHDRVRDEIKFSSPEALREQIGRDLRVMREYFTSRDHGAEPAR